MVFEWFERRGVYVEEFSLRDNGSIGPVDPNAGIARDFNVLYPTRMRENIIYGNAISRAGPLTEEPMGVLDQPKITSAYIEIWSLDEESASRTMRFCKFALKAAYKAGQDDIRKDFKAKFGALKDLLAD